MERLDDLWVSFQNQEPTPLLMNAATGEESARYEYAPFAERLRETGPMAKLNPIRFSTQYHDDYTEDDKYVFRDLRDGRWLSRDPLGETGFELLNYEGSLMEITHEAYTFVGNNPVGKIDINGLGLFDQTVGPCNAAQEQACRLGCATQGRGLDICRVIQRYDFRLRVWVEGLLCKCDSKKKPKQCVYNCGIRYFGDTAVPDIRTLSGGGTGCCLPKVEFGDKTCFLMGAIY